MANNTTNETSNAPAGNPGATSLNDIAKSVAPMVEAIEIALGINPASLSTEIGKLLAPILGEMEDRIVNRVLAGMRDTAGVSKPNEALQKDWDGVTPH